MKTINLTLKVWRQKSFSSSGAFESYQMKDISTDMSFLEMLDLLNENLIKSDKIPVEFDHDCREGICGSCSLVINGDPHGPEKATTTCQLHMRSFKDGDVIMVEPFRAKAFPIIKDLIVDRSCFDRLIQKGGYISVNTGSAQDANSVPVSKEAADDSFVSAACIGCGACVAACKNASATLFIAAKVNHLKKLPQGRVESHKRVKNMLLQMRKEQLGACTNTGACSAACPKEISLKNILDMNREVMKSFFKKMT